MISDPMTSKRNAVALIHFMHVGLHCAIRANPVSYYNDNTSNVNHVVGIGMKAAQHWMHVEENLSVNP
jgi:hypothetical protein